MMKGLVAIGMEGVTEGLAAIVTEGSVVIRERRDREARGDTRGRGGTRGGGGARAGDTQGRRSETERGEGVGGGVITQDDVTRGRGDTRGCRGSTVGGEGTEGGGGTREDARRSLCVGGGGLDNGRGGGPDG
ncbi:ctenidin-1-like [Olea europaea var. sylvestris]|uniref:ctenidin-1-like n=1 Tax=Olea europaea var. sylvestris TaxID=158386 RepID=UPI000C1D25B3|nr:ctenidin-1-like [Olea europaea var. sylvestris]